MSIEKHNEVPNPESVILHNIQQFLETYEKKFTKPIKIMPNFQGHQHPPHEEE